MKNMSEILRAAAAESAACLLIVQLAGSLGFCLGVVNFASLGAKLLVGAGLFAGLMTGCVCLLVVRAQLLRRMYLLEAENELLKGMMLMRTLEQCERLLNFVHDFFDGSPLTKSRLTFQPDYRPHLRIGDDTRMVCVDPDLLMTDPPAALERARLEWMSSEEEE
jgi:hypothetical protein